MEESNDDTESKSVAAGWRSNGMGTMLLGTMLLPANTDRCDCRRGEGSTLRSARLCCLHRGAREGGGQLTSLNLRERGSIG